MIDPHREPDELTAEDEEFLELLVSELAAAKAAGVFPVSALKDMAATHEAGHAVMRWLLGLPATGLTAGEGVGFCAGTGDTIRADDAMKLSLAGYASQWGCVAGKIDLKNEVAFSDDPANDFNEALRLLREHPRLKRIARVESGRPVYVDDLESLQSHFDEVREMLFPFAEAIDNIAVPLGQEGTLSAKRVAAILKDYETRLES